MMTLESLIETARAQGASDLHLEAGLPAALRIRGVLQTAGDPIPGQTLLQMAQRLLSGEEWESFLARRSYDTSRTIQGVRCRLNILQTARGVGFAIRILSSFEATLESLNLNPDLKRLLDHQTGLILVTGPTGSGKSSTLAALIQEINLGQTLHVLTIESPIEYAFRPRRAYIRQREVGRDTPSFEQALLDALREDPDVLMVGEMRDPETMRLTLNAAETGHLVMATLHSSTCAEALQRMVSAFAPEIQQSVASQLADCLVGVIAQRLQFRADLNLRLPECEVVTATHPVRAHIRNRDFFKIVSVLETSAEHGMWTFQRYRAWMDRRTQWNRPEFYQNPPDTAPPEKTHPGGLPTSPLRTVPPRPSSVPAAGSNPIPKNPQATGQRIDIEPTESGFGKILRPPP